VTVSSTPDWRLAGNSSASLYYEGKSATANRVLTLLTQF